MITEPAGAAPQQPAASEFLASVGAGPAALVFEGDAGIGKTTAWSQAVDAARDRGYRVLSARVGQAESVLAYAAVADLLADVDDTILGQLPDLQRLAIDRVLFRTDGQGPATDQRVTSAAFSAIVEALAAAEPTIIAIDDAQWLDPSSKAVLAFATRRLRGRIGVLATERREHGADTATSWLELGLPEKVTRVRLQPLSVGALHSVLVDRFGHGFPRAVLVRISEISGGNPFYAIELARAHDSREPHAQPVLPPTLAELVRARTDGYRGQTAEVLLTLASVSHAGVDLLARAAGTTVGHIRELLAEVDRDGVVTVDGDRVTFTHPLIARGVYADATPGRRRAVHRSLAEVEQLPELRARHLALAATTSDESTLSALDSAAQAARERGAPAAAAELLELAIGLGGNTPMRRIRAAGDHFQAGDAHRSRTLIEGVLGELRPGWLRAIALNLLAAVHIYDNNFVPAAALLTRAADDAAEAPPVLVQTLMSLTFASGMGSLADGGDGDPSGWVDEMMDTARRAVTVAEELGAPSVLSQALTMWVHTGFIHGHGVDGASLRRALELEQPDDDVPTPYRASMVAALIAAWTGDLDSARTQIQAVRRHCVERGDDRNMMAVEAYSALIAMWSGDLREAALLADEAVRRGQQLGGDQVEVIPLTVRAAVAAYRGQQATAEADCAVVLEAVHKSGSVRMGDWAHMTAGLLAVSRGDHERAMTALQPLVDRLPSVPGIELMHGWFLPDAAEAMVGLGRLDDADDICDLLLSQGRRFDRAWMLATGARCRAMVLAARGSLEEAVASAQQAMADHDRLPMPVERARTQLLLGQLQRRTKLKESAAATLQEALAAFESMGCELWVQRARAELARTNVRAGAEAGLSPTEHRVAELAATGMTNRDIAAALFISPKTVESNLSRVYRKLAIRSRAELGRRMGGR
ncbi:MAG: LuxR C-terminal-related transcriptional regulator [Actinomycetota bacterium]|nr:LuxR C-terminal-related transcriptional regulator [Actinomycetota bacterium]